MTMQNNEHGGGQVSRERSTTSAKFAGKPLRAAFVATALCACLLGTAFAGTASAKVVNLRVYDGIYPAGTFFGAGSVGGGPAPFGTALRQMDINQADGDFIVGYNGFIYKFNSAGEPEEFSALAPNTLISGQPLNTFGDVAVDNSGGAGGVGEGEQGRIYATQENGPIHGWKANGEPLPSPFTPGLSYSQACGIDVAPDGTLWAATWAGSGQIQQFDSTGTATGNSFNTGFGVCGLAIDSNYNFYVIDENGPLYKYRCVTGGVPGPPCTQGEQLGIIDAEPGEPRDVVVDRANDYVYTVRTTYMNEFDSTGSLISKFGLPEGEYLGLQNTQGMAVNSTTGNVYAANNRTTGIHDPGVDRFVQTGDITIPDVTTNDASVTPTEATLKGHVDPDAANSGTPINFCNFEWGLSANNLNNDVACDQATPINSPTDVTATIGGLTTGTTYFFKLTASNEGNGVLSTGVTKSFQPAGPPEITEEAVSDVNTDGVRISGTINPNGGFTSYRIEYGTTESYGASVPVPDAELPNNLGAQGFSHALSGLTPGTTYHYRVSATNPNGTTNGTDHVFTTFPSDPGGVDPCPNAQVRQQTGAAKLLDCRAYELASAANTGGYDVQSTLVPGLTTLPAQPRAQDRVLYSVHFGKIPGTGEPTNYGLDPYVATRGNNGWSTSYVGIPASGTPSAIPFGSPLFGTNSGLGTFAFSGENLCDPCFGDGSAGIPVRMPNGSLVQGMKGSLDPGPGAEPAGEVRKAVSDDGGHLVFGSTSKFEPAGNSGSLTIYDRNLNAGTTQVASTLPNGATMTGTVAGLDISADGSRVLIGREVSTDEAGNIYYDLYMHVGTSPNSVMVADTASGVIYNGMSNDGSKVFFTTADALAGDGDTSADLFRADVGASSAVVARVSTGTGGTGNTDVCTPVEGKESTHWNRVSGGPDCGVVGLAGGAGVASGDGTVFFLSPEKLDGSGTANEANLFVARPGGAPEHVATVEPGGEMVTNAVFDSEVHRYGDFQVTQSGDHAVLSSTLPLTGFNTFGRSQVFRYDADADALDCASCASTGAAPTSDTTLSGGLNLTDDGTVFFTSSEALVLRDTNKKRDVYEWKEGEQQLTSTGISEFDSGLLSASADGVNVFFFTRATLVPQDENGNLMKIYNAREGGGFLVIPPLPLCAAKDECHGPGTQSAPPPQIGTFKGEGGNAKEDCGAHSRKAKKESRRAKNLRRQAKSSASGKSRKRLNRNARKASRAAKRSSNAAKECRRRKKARGAG
jgi:hypothetical protein